MSSKPYRVGQWLPSDRKVVDEWLANVIKEVKVKSKDKLALIMALHPPAEDEEKASGGLQVAATSATDKDLGLHPPVEELKNAILTDPEINMFFHQMFWQQYRLPDTSEGTKIPSWQLMILIIDYIMTTAPAYNKTGLVGFPINVILNWPMATTAGFAAFLNDKVNRLFKNILNYWADSFLSTSASCYVLSKDPRHGWFGEDAMEAMPNFAKEFKCNPQAEYYGYKSWDDFFTREFRPGVRPVESPNDDSIIANACESAPFQISKAVKKRDYFWIKSQRYSLDFILNMSDLAKQFHGGTVYQAFLSATSYHRWHSPVTGTIYKTELVDGSYYSQTHNIQDDPASPNMSQGYLAQVAARGIVYIKADNPDIGLMCFVSIGMSEVSTNEITVEEGKKVKKGDQLGMFHFGGSTHCLIFRPGVNVEFDTRDQTPGLDTHNIPVKAKIATVLPADKKE